MTETAPAIRVLLVDDHPIVRWGLRAAIEREPDMLVVAEAGDGAEAMAAFRTHRPTVTLMDLRLPGQSGVQVIATLRAEFPNARFIVLSTYGTDEEIFQALNAGALGYLLKGAFREALLEAIRAVHAGQRFVPPALEARLAERAAAPALSARETEVLELLSKGLTNKQIGDALLLAEDTVKNHMRRIFAKLDVADRTEAVATAVQRGILRLD